MTMLHAVFEFFFHLYFKIFLCLSQPYYSTRVNAADIESRVKQLDQTTGEQQGEGQKSKAGFWEEFDVRFDPSSVIFTTLLHLLCQNHMMSQLLVL